jgi:hypothetical protein
MLRTLLRVYGICTERSGKSSGGDRGPGTSRESQGGGDDYLSALGEAGEVTVGGPGGGSRPSSSVMGAAGPSLFFRGREEGVWETRNRAVVLRGRGVPGSPVRFRIGPPLVCLLRSRAVVFLTSPSCLVEGVRSGTRRRRGASASAQAGGGTGPETRPTAPVRAGAALFGRYAGAVRGYPASSIGARRQRAPTSGTPTESALAVLLRASANRVP